MELTKILLLRFKFKLFRILCGTYENLRLKMLRNLYGIYENLRLKMFRKLYGTHGNLRLKMFSETGTWFQANGNSNF